MKHFLTLLLFISTSVMAGTVKLICSDNAEGRININPENTATQSSEEWRTYPKKTLLIEIDDDKKIITTKSFTGKIKTEEIYKLIIPKIKKNYIESHIMGFRETTFDECAKFQSLIDFGDDHVCKKTKNLPAATSSTILINLKEKRFIRSWLHEGKYSDIKNNESIMESQINYGSCEIDI